MPNLQKQIDFSLRLNDSSASLDNLKALVFVFCITEEDEPIDNNQALYLLIISSQSSDVICVHSFAKTIDMKPFMQFK